jgi:serine/threonine-protein kinase HipA
LAGAQDKLAVIFEDGDYFLPSARAPSSHILKFETLRWVCFAEYMGFDLARRCQLDCCETIYLESELEPKLPYLRITRFDRHGEGVRRVRVHQEDIAQALGYGARQKYQTDGGPSLAEVAELLRRHVEDPVRDVLRLRDWQLFNFLIGNSDAHAKNLALLHEGPVPRLAPFYDLVCIEFFNRIGAAHFDRSMAFWIGHGGEPEEVRRSDWEKLAKAMHVSPAALLERLLELTETLPKHAAAARQHFAESFADNQVFDRFVETIADRCSWVKKSVMKTK